jgi:cbb3-type cytochrome oxidase subunit 3
MSVLDKIKMMRKGDRIFLSWFVIVLVGYLVFVFPINDATLDYLEKYGYGSIIGGVFTAVLFLVLIPYGIYRLNRKRKQKEIDDSKKREE